MIPFIKSTTDKTIYSGKYGCKGGRETKKETSIFGG